MVFESDEGLLILGNLNQSPMTLQELEDHMVIDGELSWTQLDRDRVLRKIKYLKQARLIDWSRGETGNWRIFQITETGQEALSRWLQNTRVVERPITFSFDLLVNAMEALPLEERHQLVEKRRSNVISRLEGYKEISQRLTRDRVTQRAILQHHTIYLQAELNWLDQLENDIASWNVPTIDIAEAP
jgi:DNA-binding PadR family transcriptional regulator